MYVEEDIIDTSKSKYLMEGEDDVVDVEEDEKRKRKKL